MRRYPSSLNRSRRASKSSRRSFDSRSMPRSLLPISNSDSPMLTNIMESYIGCKGVLIGTVVYLGRSFAVEGEMLKGGQLNCP